MATRYNNYRNRNTVPIAEITYEMPGDGAVIYDLVPNPIVTITYTDGTKNVFDTNLIYKRGREAGKKKANDEIKRKLGLD